MRHIFIFALFFSLAGSAAIQDIVLVSEGVNTKLIIKADAPFVANTFTLKDPARIVVDCSGISSSLIGKKYDVDRGGVKALTVTGFTAQADLVRIVGEMSSDYSFLTLVQENNFVVTLLTGLTSSFPEWQASTAPQLLSERCESFATQRPLNR